jgi:hypothetical protein
LRLLQEVKEKMQELPQRYLLPEFQEEGGQVMDRADIYDKIYELSAKRGVHTMTRMEQIELYITLFEELTKEEKCTP